MREADAVRKIFFVVTRRVQIAVLVGLASAIMTTTLVLLPVDQLLYDAGQRLARRLPPDDLLIVAIDEASIRELGRWPWSREWHARLLDILAQAGVKAVVMDIVFADPQPSANDVDAVLAAAIERAGNVILPVHISQLQRRGQLLEVLPIPSISAAAVALGHAHYEIDADGVCRAVFLREGIGEPYWPHLSVVLAEFVGDPLAEPLPGQRVAAKPEDPLSVRRNFRNLIPFFDRENSLPTVSYHEILQGRVPDAILDNKIVFVGATAVGLGDRVVTPTSSDVGLLSGVELNATIYHALRSSGFIRPLASEWQLLINVCAAFLIALVCAFMAPRQLMVFVASGIIGINCLALVAPYYTGAWVAPTVLSVSFLLSYLLWSLSRLQQALRYLRGELRNLSRERSFLQRPKDIDEIYAGLHFLVRILPLSGWSVSCNGAKLVSWGVSKNRPQNEVPDADEWHHQGADSFISIQINGDGYQIRLTWQSGTDVDPRAYLLLDSLVSNFKRPPEPALPRAPEAVTDAILRLKRANLRFREISHLAQRSLSRMADGIAITDRSGRLLFENLQFRGLLHGNEDAGDANIFDVVAQLQPVAGDQWEDILRPVYLGGKAAQCEAIAPSGTNVLCQVHALNSEAREHLIMFVITDISVLKEYEQARTETLNFLSHDLRSPLVSILALIEGARADKQKAQDPELLDTIERYANTNLRFAESFLQLARAEATEMIAFEPTDMHAVVENAVAQVYHAAAAKNIQLQQDYCEEDAWILGHSDLLERAVANLLTNAIKYSAAQTQVQVRLVATAGDIRCQIADQGIGIPASELDQIFERFRRGTGLESEGSVGIGLGLRFVSVVCARHAGEVSVCSEPGQGSEFTLTFPRYQME